MNPTEADRYSRLKSEKDRLQKQVKAARADARRFQNRVAELEEAARSLLNRASRPLNLGEILLQQALNGKDGD